MSVLEPDVREPSDPIDRRPEWGRREWPLGVLVAVAILLFASATPLTSFVAGVLPAAAKVTSAGTYYPPFEESFPTILRGLGIVTLGAAGLAHAVARVRLNDRSYRVLLALLVGGTSVLYGWLAYPHNGFPSNARIHWVDIFHGRSEDYFYALVKLPHMIFYDVPWLLQALNGAANVALTAWIVHRFTRRRWAALGAAASYAASSQLLRFADSAEDLQLTILALLLVVVAYATRRPVWLAVAMFGAMLARPPFLLVVPAFVLAEVVTAAASDDSLGDRVQAAVKNRFMWVTIGAFTAMFVVWHTWLHLAAEPWFLTGGRIIDRGTLDVEPRAIDGYTISPFAGTYVGHLGWLVPLPVWAAIAVVGVRLNRLDTEARRFFIFAAAFVAATILMNEAIVVLYFNVRYATYAFPFLLLLAWLVPNVVRPRSTTVAAAAALVLVASMSTPPHVEFDTRARVASRPLAQVAQASEDLRELGQGRTVTTTFGRRSDINYLAYLFRRRFNEIMPLDGSAPPDGSIVVTDDPDRFRGEVMYSSDALYVIRSEDPPDSS